MLLTNGSKTRDLKEARLPFPALGRGARGYHHDLLSAIARHFGREKVDLNAVDQILTPLSHGGVVAAAHAIAGRSILALDAGIISSTEEVSRWHGLLKKDGVSGRDIEEVRSRTKALYEYGKEIKIEFYDRSISAEEMQELLRQHRLGLVSLDWREITSDEGFREITKLRSPSHVFPEIKVGKEPVFYPVVPLVGYTNNGQGMLVHTHLFPFIEIPTSLFERARESSKAERTVVFFYESYEKAHRPTSEYSWKLPGAFTGSLLLRPEQIPPTPVPTMEELTRTMRLAMALGKASSESFHFVFPHFLKAASLLLAKNDRTGADIRALEDHLIKVAEAAPKHDPSGSLFWATRDWFESGLKGGISNQAQLVKFIKGAEKNLLDDEDVSQEEPLASTALAHTSVFTGGREQILEYFKGVVDRAFLPYDRHVGTKETSEEIIAVVKECIKAVKSYEIGSAYVESLSPSQRMLGQLHRFVNFSNHHKSLASRISNLEYEHAFCPRIMLAASPHRNEEKGRNRISPLSDADEKALADHDILMLAGKGFSIASCWYDEKLGTLIRSDHTPIQELIYAALSVSTGKPNPGDSWSAEKLAKVLSQFAISDEQFARMTATLEAKEGGIEDYLKDPKSWLGTQVMSNKPWLENTTAKGYKKAIQYLVDMRDVLLNGDKAAHHIEFNPAIAPLTMSSMLANIQAEGIFLEFVERSVTGRTRLADVVLERIGKQSAAKYLEDLSRHEELHMPERYFESNKDGTLKLTKYGVDYLITLIDPEYPYHHTFDNSREMRQSQHEKRRRYY